jgi:hypothetical protein
MSGMKEAAKPSKRTEIPGYNAKFEKDMTIQKNLCYEIWESEPKMSRWVFTKIR